MTMAIPLLIYVYLLERQRVALSQVEGSIMISMHSGSAFNKHFHSLMFFSSSNVKRVACIRVRHLAQEIPDVLIVAIVSSFRQR